MTEVMTLLDANNNANRNNNKDQDSQDNDSPDSDTEGFCFAYLARGRHLVNSLGDGSVARHCECVRMQGWSEDRKGLSEGRS